MSNEPNRPLVGVLLGFTCAFLLLVKREDTKTPQDDAEALLARAQHEMHEVQATNRELAVQAITQKNNLQALSDQTQKMADSLRAKAEKAGAEGDHRRERQLMAEHRRYERIGQQMAPNVQTAITTAEAVKAAMRREEESIRAKTAEALALKAQYRQAQIEFEIEKSRLGMTTSTAGEWFERARAKIQQAQARRDLMAQIRQTADLLEEAAEAAKRRGDVTLNRRLLSERDKLQEAGLNPRLWNAP